MTGERFTEVTCRKCGEDFEMDETEAAETAAPTCRDCRVAGTSTAARLDSFGAQETLDGEGDE